MIGSQKASSFLRRRVLNSLSLRIRLLPIVIGCATLMLALRVYDIKILLGSSEQLFGISELNAEPNTNSSKDTIQGREKIIPPTSLTEPGQGRKESFDPLNLTAEEVRVLESLSERKHQLDKKEADMEERQQVLLSLEKRIDVKVIELQALKKNIEELVQHHDEAETAKLKSLIKIYEIMKPKEAATLFSKMDLRVLLEVLGQMKEAKAAAIMGKMAPHVARIVTEELARRQMLTDEAHAQIQNEEV